LPVWQLCAPLAHRCTPGMAWSWSSPRTRRASRTSQTSCTPAAPSLRLKPTMQLLPSAWAILQGAPAASAGEPLSVCRMQCGQSQAGSGMPGQVQLGRWPARLPGRYEADETPMVEYLNASNIVEQRRRAAREAGGQGPRTIVRCSSARPPDADRHPALRTRLHARGLSAAPPQQLGTPWAEPLSVWQAAVWPQQAACSEALPASPSAPTRAGQLLGRGGRAASRPLRAAQAAQRPPCARCAGGGADGRGQELAVQAPAELRRALRLCAHRRRPGHRWRPPRVPGLRLRASAPPSWLPERWQGACGGRGGLSMSASDAQEHDKCCGSFA